MYRGKTTKKCVFVQQITYNKHPHACYVDKFDQILKVLVW